MRKQAMRKDWVKLLILFWAVLTLCGCGENLDKQQVIPEKTPLISEREIGQVYNPMALYAYSLLHYDEKIYNSVETYQETSKEALLLDSYVDKEIGKVSGNHGIFWSVDEAELATVTVEGTLYKLKGYETQARVGIYYENVVSSGENYYQLVIFEYHNDDIYD